MKVHTEKQIERARKLREEIGLTYVEISRRMDIPATTLRGWGQTREWKQFIPEDSTLSDPLNPQTIEIERLEGALSRERLSASRQRSLYRSLRQRYDALSSRVGIIEEAGMPVVRTIRTKRQTGATEGTVVMPASDWHVEEEVKPTDVNGLNEFNRKVCDNRVKRYFKSAERLIRLFKQDLKITDIVFPLLGDYITNDLHDENSETALALPMDAIMIAQSYLASGVAFLLENTDCKILLPCHSGNHGRTTRQVHITTEYGHSLEYLMYKNLEWFFKDEPRVEFMVARGYHSYVNVYDKVLRFHHGHQIRYGGGVGGIYIPVNKAISQWNKAKRADMDYFGHFHQLRDGGNFICNGSLIGYSAFGISIKADFERPQQAFSVFDNKHGRTFTCPILVDQ